MFLQSEGFQQLVSGGGLSELHGLLLPQLLDVFFSILVAFSPSRPSCGSEATQADPRRELLVQPA